MQNQSHFFRLTTFHWRALLVAMLFVLGWSFFGFSHSDAREQPYIRWEITEFSPNENGFLLLEREYETTFASIGGEYFTPVGSIDPVKIEARVSMDGEKWSNWYSLESLEPEDRPDFDPLESNQYPLDFLPIQPSRHLQIRVSPTEPGLLSCSASPDGNNDENATEQIKSTDRAVEAIQFETPLVERIAWLEIDVFPFEESKNESSSFFSTAEAAAPDSNIIPRSSWNTSCFVDPNTDLFWPPDYFKIEKIVVHHTAGGDGVNSLESGKQQVDAICRYHTFSRGWGDIGYNYLIDQLGNVYEGREGGEGVEGGHAYAANKGSVGIAMIGTYTSQDITPAARASLEKLAANLSQRYHLNPAGNNTLTRWCYSFTGPVVAGHRDYATYYKDGYCNDLPERGRPGSTQCPGDTFYSTLDSVRSNAAAYNPLQPAVGQFVGEYYASDNVSGTPVAQRIEGSNGQLNFNWGNGVGASGQPSDNFSVRWRGEISVTQNGIYTFFLRHDDGMRLYIDNELQYDDWGGNSFGERQVEVGLHAGEHSIRLEYFDQSGGAQVGFRFQQKTLANNHFVGTYYGNAVFQGLPFMVREDEGIDFNWGTEDPSPIFGIGDNYYSVDWRGAINIPVSGPFTFEIEIDDRARLYINDMSTPLIDAWSTGSGVYSGNISLDAGTHQVKMIYVEDAGEARAQLRWYSLQGEAFSSPNGLLVQDVGGSTLFQTAPNEEVKVYYADVDRRYVVNYEGNFRSSDDYLILTPVSGNPGIVTTETCPSRPHTGVQGCTGNYRDFRGQIVLRASEIAQELNIINRLPVEDYLRGTGETGGNNPIEYTKTLVVSMRTNALNYASRGGKYPDEYYDVINTTSSQVYHGYAYELAVGLNSNLQQAVNATSSQVLTHPQSNYPNDLILSTFFSQTGDSGQTCGWAKDGRCTWNVANNWYWIPQNGVADPWWEKSGQCYREDDNGRTQQGHGYGVSGRGAECFAAEEGRDYRWIFNYYYDGVNVVNYPGGASNALVNVGIYAVPFSGLTAPDSESESPLGLPNGLLITDGEGNYYLMENNVLKPFPNLTVFLANGYQFNFVQQYPASELRWIPAGPPVLFANGTLLKNETGADMYLIEGGQRRWISSQQALENNGLANQRYVLVSQEIIDLHPLGAAL